MSCGEREKRPTSTMDTRLVKKMKKEQQTITCKNGHLNSLNASICWICGEPLEKEAQS